jgi:carboxyl-terminal processing protease
MTLREKDLSGHLENANGAASRAADEKNGKAAAMLAKDNQLRLALEMVRNLPRLSKIQ